MQLSIKKINCLLVHTGYSISWSSFEAEEWIWNHLEPSGTLPASNEAVIRTIIGEYLRIVSIMWIIGCSPIICISACFPRCLYPDVVLSRTIATVSLCFTHLPRGKLFWKSDFNFILSVFCRCAPDNVGPEGSESRREWNRVVLLQGIWEPRPRYPLEEEREEGGHQSAEIHGDRHAAWECVEDRAGAFSTRWCSLWMRGW